MVVGSSVCHALLVTERPRCVVVAVAITLHDLVVSFFAMNRWGVCIFVCSVSVYKVHPLIFENVCRENAEMHGGWETTMEKCVTVPLQNCDSLSMWYRRDDPRRTSISRKPRRKITQAVDALEEAMRQWTSWVKTLKSTRKAHCSRRIRGADGWIRSAVENELSEGRLSGPVERCCCSKCVVSLLKMCGMRCIVI